MINTFKSKKIDELKLQKIFVEKALEVFEPLFSEYNFETIKCEFDKTGSIILFAKEKKFIQIIAQNEFREGSFFEIMIGGKFNNEINFFEDYYISINRLARIINYKTKEFYEFPFGEKQAINILNKAKIDFLECAKFYLKDDIDLFDKVLKLKGIRN